jgi:hypothetical protein
VFGQQRLAWKPDLLRETTRALADDENMWGSFHHRPRDRDRGAVIAQRTHGSRRTGRAVHDRGVELDLTVDVRIAAITDGVIVGIVLDESDDGFHCVERAASG